MDLVPVFDAILTSREMREKLQCLYENLMSNNFRKTAVLKKKTVTRSILKNRKNVLKAVVVFHCLIAPDYLASKFSERNTSYNLRDSQIYIDAVVRELFVKR